MTGGPGSRATGAGLLVAALVVEVAARASGGPGLLAALRLSLFAQFAWAASLFLYSLSERRDRPRRRALRAAVVILVTVAALRTAGVLAVDAAGALALLGLGTLGFASLAAAARLDPAEWTPHLNAAATLAVGVASAPYFLWLSGRVNPVDDFYVFAFEESLGVRFSVLGVALFQRLPVVATVSSLAYFALPAGIAVVHTLVSRRGDAPRVVSSFATLTAVGFALYFVFPVVGPLTVFGAAYPDHLPVPGTIVAGDWIAPDGPPRNGMPSLHAAWAYLIWFSARPLGPLARRSLRVFAAFNVLATMGLPDTHWVTDLVVALPLTVAVLGACESRLARSSPERLLAAGGGAALVGLWFAALWWGTAWFQSAPAAAWSAVIATLAGCLAVERRLWTTALRVASAPAVGVNH